MKRSSRCLICTLCLLLSLAAPMSAWAQGNQGTLTGISFGTSLPIACNPMYASQRAPVYYLTVSEAAYAPGLYSCIADNTWAPASGGPPGTETSGTITTAANSNFQVPFTNMGCVGFVLSGTWTGSLHAQQSNDGINWQDADTFMQMLGNWVTFLTINGRYYSGGYAAAYFRLLGPVLTGTANVTMQTSAGTCNSYVNSIPNVRLGNGTFVPTAATGSLVTTPDVIQGMDMVDMFVLWSGITGSPSGCVIQMLGTGDGVNFLNVGPPIPVTPGVNFSTVVTGPFGLQGVASYGCSGAYPSAGTIFIQLDYKANVPPFPFNCIQRLTVAGFGATSPTTEIPGVANQTIKICSASASEVGTFTANAITFSAGTGTNCATGNSIIGAIATTNGTSSIALGYEGAWVLPPSNSLCFAAATTTPTMIVTIMYAQF